MFQGSTNAAIRSYLAKELQRDKPQRVYESFAGNFMVSQIVGMVDRKIAVRAADVSIYSCLLGCAMEGRDSGYRLTNEALLQFPAFAGKTSPDELAAIAAFFSEACLAIEKSGIRYYERMLNDLKARSEEYLKAIVDKVKKARENMGNFTFVAQDAGPFLAHPEEGDVVVFDMPLFVLGYEKTFKNFDKWWQGSPAPYTPLTPSMTEGILQSLHERGVKVYWRSNVPVNLPNYEPVFESKYKPGASYFIYSNSASARTLLRSDSMNEKRQPYDVLYKTDDITNKSKVQLVQVNTAIANHYRLLWTKKAPPKNLGSSFMVVIDGKIAGVITVNAGQTYGHKYVVLVADAANTFTKYRKLSKLIILLVLTREFLDMVNNFFVYEHEGVTTVAYSNEPVSMKYRGLFDLIERKENKESGHKYKLAYRTTVMRHPTLKAAFKNWLQKYGRDTD